MEGNITRRRINNLKYFNKPLFLHKIKMYAVNVNKYICEFTGLTNINRFVIMVKLLTIYQQEKKDLKLTQRIRAAVRFNPCPY